MKAKNCVRDGCTVNGKQITYQTLCARYVCNECGGAIVHGFARDDFVHCGRCGCDEIVSERRYLEQIAEGWEVLEGLPEALHTLLKGEPQCLSATEAVADLFG